MFRDCTNVKMQTEQVKEDINIIFEDSNGIRYEVTPFAALQPEIDILTEDQKSTIYCCICSKKFTDSVGFEHHNVEMHGHKKVACPLCSTLFRRQDHMRRHVQTVHSQETYTICPVCSKECTRQDLLVQHIKACHPSDNKYQLQQVLEVHQMTHMSLGRFACTQCTATFKRRDHLIRHVKSRHTMEFVDCKVCHKVFKRRDHMLRHVREKHQMVFIDGKLLKPKK